MNKIVRALCVVALMLQFSAAEAQDNDKPAYLLYNDKGEAVKFSDMIEDLSQDDVVFFGEYHNSSLVHWLEHEVVEALADIHQDKINLGMEMLEVDTQGKIDEYMAGLISSERFLAETYLWPNYKMDYSPIVELAKERGIRVVATNVPRRYARALAYNGVDALREFPEWSQQFYGEVLDRVAEVEVADDFFSGMGGAMGGAKVSADEQKTKVLRMTQAQALKDAVMAGSIAKNLNYPFIQINGCYHSDSRGGTVKFLLEQHPELAVGLITTVYQEDLSSLEQEYRGKADYYIVLPNDTHKTY